MRGVLIAGLVMGLGAAQTSGPLEVKTAPSRAKAAEAPLPEESPTSVPCPDLPPDKDDPGTPILARDNSNRRRPASEAGPRDCPVVKGSVVEVDDPAVSLLNHTIRASTQFIVSLPNFVCDQLTDRYEGSVRRAPKWKLRDRVSAEVLMVDGVESYRNLRRNGKAMGDAEMWRSGTWSTGEFGTVLRNLLARSTEARFVFRKETTFGGFPAHLYDYAVAQPNSRWKVEFEGYGVFPEFTGSIWIDLLSKRVMRVEMLAHHLPLDFPMDMAEMTVDYGPVMIAGQSYLMPVRSENLACQRGTSRCVRNSIEFRNYRKFTSDSNITTTDSTITFDGGPEAKK